MDTPINRKIRKVVALASGIAAVNVRPANQDAPLPKELWSTVLITSELATGTDAITYTEAPDDEVIETVDGMRECTASIQFFRAGAFAAAKRLRARIKLSNAIEIMQAEGIGFVSITDVRDISGVYGSTNEERAQVELVFNAIDSESLNIKTYGTFPVELHVNEASNSGTDQQSNFEVFEP